MEKFKIYSIGDIDWYPLSRLRPTHHAFSPARRIRCVK